MEGDDLTYEVETQPDEVSPSPGLDPFDSAYQGALQGVLYATQEVVEGGQAFTMDDAQYEQISQSLRLVGTCSVLSLLLSAAVLGSLVWRSFVGGWRR